MIIVKLLIKMNDKEKRTFLLRLSTDAQAFSFQGKKEEALKCYDDILAKYPDEMPAVYGKGMVHYEFNEFQEALDYFDQILANNENETDSLYAKGSILSTIGRNEDALEILNKVLKINPRMDIAWLAKGYVMLELDKAEEAISCFKKVDELGHGLDVSNGKGHAYRKMNKLQEAKEWYNRAYKLDPYDPEALFGLGIVEFESQNLKDAQEFLYKSVIQDEQNLDAWEVLAKIYKKTKQNEKEKVAIDKIKELKKQ